MRKIIATSALMVAFACSTRAGEMPNGIVDPPPPTANTTTTNTTTSSAATTAVMQTVLQILLEII